MAAVYEGKIDFKVGSETYQTWYKTYGDVKNSKHRPLVLVHGGPGMSHHYLLYVEFVSLRVHENSQVLSNS